MLDYHYDINLLFPPYMFDFKFVTLYGTSRCEFMYLSGSTYVPRRQVSKNSSLLTNFGLFAHIGERRDECSLLGAIIHP
jgi:hypothetical protein